MALPSPCCSVAWTVGRLWNQASHNGRRPIKLLIHRNSPGCKRPTQGLYLCSGVGLGRELPASPCSIAHRSYSVSDKYNTMMPDTVSPITDFSVPAVRKDLQGWCCHLVVAWNLVLLEWKTTNDGCLYGTLNAADHLNFTAEVRFWLHIHSTPINSRPC